MRVATPCPEGAKSGKAEFNSYHQFAGYEIAGVLYFDTAIDIAIIKLKTSKQLPHLDLARQPPEKGEPLMIFGAPDGAPFVANPGSDTAVNMASDLPDKYGTHWKGYWIRTDAKVWHGNSGGPMISLDSHRVVGVAFAWLLLQQDGNNPTDVIGLSAIPAPAVVP